MKILYVGGMSGPLRDILSGKKEDEITHAAQFFHVWYKLVKRGHQVDFVITSNFGEKPTIKVDWFSENNIIANIYDPASEAPAYRRIFRRIKRFIKLSYATYKATKKTDYDFIYCITYHEGIVGNIIANHKGIHNGMRSMGTMLYVDFKKYGVWGTALRRPIEFLMFRLKKDFFVMTDDGTHGDKVYEAWKPTPEKYKFYFWKTGIDIKTINEIKSSINIPQHNYIFFAARFDGWKRHDRILKILHLLHQKDKKLHLYLAGDITYGTCYDNFMSLVKQYKLEQYVHFMGSIKQDDVKVMAYHAVANPLMYDVSNLGNVFFEIFSVGAIVLGLNDGSLDNYLKEGENGFSIDDENQACEIIIKLLEKPELRKNISRNAVQFAQENFLSLDERFDKEVDLIEKAIRA